MAKPTLESRTRLITLQEWSWIVAIALGICGIMAFAIRSYRATDKQIRQMIRGEAFAVATKVVGDTMSAHRKQHRRQRVRR